MRQEIRDVSQPLIRKRSLPALTAPLEHDGWGLDRYDLDAKLCVAHRDGVDRAVDHQHCTLEVDVYKSEEFDGVFLSAVRAFSAFAFRS